MQPLTRVRPRAITNWDEPDTIPQRPKVAIRIAECIAEWADIETMLGITLALMLDAEPKAALAMYASVENRSAQRRMILAASHAKLTPAHHDVTTVLMRKIVTPVMKQRDKLAHWSWGYSPDLPDDLLLATPDHKMERHLAFLRRGGPSVLPQPMGYEKIFVVTEQFLIRLGLQMRDAERLVTEFAATIWQKNSQQERDEHLQKLSNEPPIRSGLDRLAEGRQKNQEAPQSSRQPGRNGED